MTEKTNTTLTSVRVEKKLHLEFKKKLLDEGVSITKKINELIRNYVNGK